MIDIAEIRTAFPEFTEIEGLADSGQKLVLSAMRNQQQVVLKLVKPAADVRDRMRREIDAVAELDCVYIPAIRDHGLRQIGAEQRLYIVEDRIAGQSYRERLDDSSPRALEEVLHVGSSLLSACRDFSAASLVHRDIKPENLMFDPDGKIWVIDFGIVRFLNRTSLTGTARRFGLFTPGYGAPEQLRNVKVAIDVRADLFSTGVVMYEALRGENPYIAGARDGLEVVRRMEASDLPRLDSVVARADVELANFIAALTARFPSRRPQSAQEAIDWFTPIRRRLTR